MNLFSLSKTAQLESIRSWYEHPVTAYLIEELTKKAIATKKAVLYDDPPGIFEPRFLLREQLIGEQRGLESPIDIVNTLRDKLVEEETSKDKNENEQLTENTNNENQE